MTPWLVCSPEYGEIVPITDEGQGPIDYGCDVVFVEAESRRDALLLGVQMFRQQDAKYLHDCENPYAGVRVKSQACSAHGLQFVVWARDHYECSECESIGQSGETEP